MKAVKYILAMAAVAAAFASCSKKEEIVGTNDKPGFFLNRTQLALNKGTSESLTATITPKGAGTVTWSTSDASVVTVEDGLVTAVGGGEAVVSASYGSQTLTCDVQVSALVTTVTLNEHDVDFDKGDTRELTYVIGPEDVNVPLTVTWTSTDESVLTVDEEGVVTAVGGGQASVVVSVNGVTDVCELFSHCYPTGVVITPATAQVNVNKTLQFEAALLPEDCTEELAFEWSVEDPTLASVDANGLVKGLAAGDTHVIVKAGEFSASADLNVKREVKTVEVRPNSVNYTSGEITFTFSSGCYYFSTRYGMEIPNGQSFTISVPDDYQIDAVTFTPTYGQNGDFTVDKGNYTRDGGKHSWEATEATSSVTFTRATSQEADILVFTITYE